MNNNQRGRITGLPGTETTVTLYPQRLGVRMRNSVIRMLENRVLEGTWASKSRSIAQRLADQNGLQFGTHNWNGVRVVNLTSHAANTIRGLVQADWTAWILQEPTYRKGYYRNCFDQAMSSIDRLDQDFFVYLHDRGSIRKVLEILAENTSQELKDKAKQVANLLRGTEPIHITTFRS